LEKAIIVLDGINRGKNKFLQIIKNENHEYFEDDGYWVWNINANDVVGVAARTLKFDDERNESYYNFVKELKELANKHTNFETKYYAEMVGKFQDNPKPQLLVIHGVEKDLINYLKETYGVFTILITKYKKDIEINYDITLSWNPDLEEDTDFVEEVKGIIQKLTK
jgi:hypothetical protein